MTPRQEREYLRANCYWKRIMYRKTWKEIADELGIHVTEARFHAYTYADRYKYPTPMVPPKNTQQDIYIARQNGSSWARIARLYEHTITEVKSRAKHFSQTKGLRWPPFVRKKT